MQSARAVQSAEAQGHLRDAHSRVMSIAAVQRHLSSSELDMWRSGLILHSFAKALLLQ
jgi:two-component sensor histidine kinase